MSGASLSLYKSTQILIGRYLYFYNCSLLFRDDIILFIRYNNNLR